MNRYALLLLTLLLAACGQGFGDAGTPGARADLAPPAPLVIAHRGYSALAPENSLVAVQRAIEAGADFVEIDVQLSADGGIVVMHDTTLSRTTNAPLRYPARSPWSVSAFTLAEMQGLDAGTWFGYAKDPGNFSYVGEPVPSLREALDLLRDRAGLLLEVKSPHLYPGIENAIALELEAAGWVDGSGQSLQRLIVQSFDWDSMAIYAALHPGVSIGLLGGAPTEEAVWARISAYAHWLNPSHGSLTAASVAEIQRRGFRTSPYTVNDPARMRELLGFGVNGIISDEVELLRAARDELTP